MHTATTARTALFVVGLIAFAAGLALGGESGIYTATPDEHGLVLKTPDGRTVFRYMTKKPAGSKLTANSVCCLYPVKTPSGEDVVEFAPDDHPHHRGVFMTWHAIDGKVPADFWGWGQFAPTKDRVIQSRSARLAKADARHAVLEAQNAWVAEGQTLIEETTTIVVRQEGHAYVVDFDFRLLPKMDLTLKQTAFSGFCVKSRKGATAAYFDPQGEVKRPDPHHLKPETDWPAADWYDYTFPTDGKQAGVAVIDHPENPKTAWHNLKPIAMLNPCIVTAGPVALREGQPLRLRYRMVVHDGPTPVELLKELAKKWRTQ